MKIFASWSGEQSHRVAALLKTWLEDVLQGCSVWLSSEDAEKGSVWFNEVTDSLKETAFGILCVTAHNATAPWLLFEAGSLSKGLTASRVSPLLIDLSPSDLKPPLSFLNATVPTEADMLRLVRNINSRSGESQLSAERLEKTFKLWWPAFAADFDKIKKSPGPQGEAIPKRPEREILEEISDMTKSILRGQQDTKGADIMSALTQKLSVLEARLEMVSRERDALADKAHILDKIKFVGGRGTVSSGGSAQLITHEFEVADKPESAAEEIARRVLQVKHSGAAKKV